MRGWHTRTRSSVSEHQRRGAAEAFARAQRAVDSALALDNNLARRTGSWAFSGSPVISTGRRGGGIPARAVTQPRQRDLYDHLGWLCSAMGRFDESLALMRRPANSIR